MNVISISKKKFEGLEKISLSDVNTEGVIYDFPYLRQEKLLKKLYVQEGINLASKLFTIEMLNSNQEVLPNYFIVPESLVSVNKKVVGFLLPYINGVTLKRFLSNKNFPIEEQIKYLKKVGDILDKMKKIRKHTELKDFYLNDIHESNFMVNFDTGQLCVIDLDSSKVSPHFCFPARYLTKNALLNNVSKYNNTTHKTTSHISANEQTDLYCYIIMILNYLFGDNINSIGLTNFYDYLNYLEFIGIDKELISCFRKIVSYGENINPKSILDSLNMEQIYRARKNVYEKVKSNRKF